jgi:4-diphosphocytidyl-2-C-methyl-D-erythritol kinase
VLINSYAKINLYLDVLNKRIDGYHEIETLFSTIDLHDSLKFVLTKKPEIQILSNIPELASANNLVSKVATRIIDDFGVKNGIRIYLKKNIPVAAGLGGGSSNAAVTFIALNALLQLNMKEEYMQNTAAEFGSDLNFFFDGGLARGNARGEKITPLPDGELMQLLLVNPGIAVSSKEAYELVDKITDSYNGPKIWFNKLETCVKSKYTVIEDILSSMKYMGAAEAMMSGSGPTCIGYFTVKGQLQKAVEYFNTKLMWNKVVKTMGRSQYQRCFRNLN